MSPPASWPWFLRPTSLGDMLPAVAGEGVELRPPQMRDFEAWAALRERSRAFLAPWEPSWPRDDLTRAAFRARLRRYARDVRADAGYPFLLFTHDAHHGGTLVGGLTIGQVRRGVAQTAALGYWMGEPFAGRGLMTAAVRALAPFVFGALRLRRLEAACLPHNTASIRLLERVGFQREGYARQYLCIAGEWRDHVLYALLADDLQRPAQGRAAARAAHRAPDQPSDTLAGGALQGAGQAARQAVDRAVDRAVGQAVGHVADPRRDEPLTPR